MTARPLDLAAWCAEQPDTPTTDEDTTVITHQTLMTRVARQLVAQTGWRTDCTELMADGDTVTVLAHRSGARIEARTTRDGDLAEVCLVGLGAATIADLAHAIARDGVPA